MHSDPPKPRNLHIAPVAPTAPRRWDMPSDHEMTDGEKSLWRIGIYGALLAIPILVMKISPFTFSEAMAHQAIGIHCQFGVYMGRVNIPMGEPGYHFHHDPDHDGVACEQSRLETSNKSAGGARFVRPL